ncbi:MAG: T9SS type A sorting domain-containing protein [Bacteroidales bacterium]|nr:T9SS type A sorting domain-containing protein [Bacteroidales bacterium]
MRKTLFLLLFVAFSTGSVLDVNAQELPAEWAGSDIGTMENPGSASFNAETGVLTLTGAGLNFWDTDDAHFAYVKIDGDFEFEARILTFEGELGGAAKAGIDARNSLDTDAPSVMMAWENWGGLATTARKGPGETPSWQGGTYPGAGAIPWYLKITRIGDLFYTFESVDKSSWVKVDTLDFPTMQSTIFVGLAISPNNGEIATATFDSIKITGSVVSGIGEFNTYNKTRNVFPNPVHDQLYISLGDDESVTSLSISDIKGSVVFKSNEGFKSGFVDVSSLKPGMYFLNVVTNKGSSTNKFIRK